MSTNYTPIDLTQFTTRVQNCFRAENIFYVEQVASMTDNDLLMIPNLGKHALAQIRAVIPQKNSIAYMREFLKDLKAQVTQLERLLDNHSKVI